MRRALDELRARVTGASGTPEEAAAELEQAVAGLPDRLEAELGAAVGRPLRRVLNATGIFLHTNLGRSPLPREVAARLPAYLNAYCDLEMDLGNGRRGDRNRRVEGLLTALTGAEAAVVTNNNAAALVLILAAHAAGREVVVSRGELVEIGGSFRVPEILEAAGTRLVEVGTTNRTRLNDYESAIGDDTGALLKVYPSNYRISGFVEAVSPGDLAELGGRYDLPVVVDEGSGLLRSHRAPQLSSHVSIQELIAAGCDLVCGSGDKLVGGPQAGLLFGRREAVERCRRHPLYRALRPDRAAFAALEEVLRLHLAGRPMPIDSLWPAEEEHRRRLENLAEQIGARVEPAEAYVGGGSAPEAPIVGHALALDGDGGLLRRLRLGSPAVVGYIRSGRLVLDLRTVDPADDAALVEAVNAARAAG
jgi:L-seryl-tRNA(Ser) seleniumtransferase